MAQDVPADGFHDDEVLHRIELPKHEALAMEDLLGENAMDEADIQQVITDMYVWMSSVVSLLLEKGILTHSELTSKEMKISQKYDQETAHQREEVANKIKELCPTLYNFLYEIHGEEWQDHIF